MKRIIGSLGLITLCWLIGSCGDSPTGPPPPPPPPTTAVVVMSATTSTLVPAQTLQLSATAEDISGQVLSRTFAWTSSDQAKATVSSSGMVSGVAPGTATITAAVDGKSATTIVTVLDGGVVSSVGTTLNLMSGGVQVIVPDSAVLTPINMSVVPSTAFASDPRVVKGTPFEFGPSGTTFAKPITIKIKYDPANLPQGTEKAALQIHVSVPGWQPVETSTVDTAANVVTAQVSHFSTYAILTPLPVASVDIRAPPGKIVAGVSTLIVGETEQLTAALADAQGQPLSNRAVTWATANRSVATVSSDGLVTTMNPGSTTVSATAGGVTSSITVTVTPFPVSSVAVTLTPQTITVGQTSQATAVLKDSKGAVLTGRSILWASDNSAVATVNSATGVVTAVAAGPATITGTSEGQSGAATITVTPAPVASVTVSPATASVVVGSTQQLTAATKDAAGAALTGRVVSWQSDHPEIATVSASGLVTAVTPGSATISATSEGKSGGATITVTAIPVASVVLSAPTTPMNLGQTQQLTATPKDGTGNVLAGRTVTWISSNPAVLTVSAASTVSTASGAMVTVTATGLGTAIITAASESAPSAATPVITVNPIPVATVTISPSSATLVLGVTPTQQLGATLKDGNDAVLTGRTVTWSSSNPAAATVDANGFVTAVATGTSTITATSEGKSGISSITVSLAPVASVTVGLVPTSITAVGTSQATVTTLDSNGNPVTGRVVTWSSDNTAVATVDAQGVITAVAIGTANIIATSEGKTGTAALTVTPASVASVTVVPPSASLVEGSTVQLSAETRDAKGRVITGRLVTWSTDAPQIATVSAAGLVTAVAPGTAKITAESENKIAMATITVTAIPVATVNVSLASGTVIAGQTTQATATTLDGSGQILTGRIVAWSSDDASIATVSSTGVVTSHSAGVVHIIAVSEAKTGNGLLTVGPVPVNAVAVNPPTASVIVGATQQLAATAKDINDNTLTGRVIAWSSSDPTRANVSSNGLVTAVAVGPAVITATSEGKTGSSSITVTPVPVASVTVSLTPNSITAVGTSQAAAVTLDVNGAVLPGRAISWSSSNTTVATVSAQGVVTAVAEGTASIIAISETKTGSAVLTVTPAPVATVIVSPPSATMFQNATEQLSVVLEDAHNNVLLDRSVVWSSSNTAVATVSTSGLVTAAAGTMGTATITATSETKTGASTITVSQVPVATVNVVVSPSTINVGQNAQASATLKDASNNVLTGRTVTWTSDNTTVATVSSGGAVTALTPGTAHILGASGGQSGSATLTVTPIPVASVTASLVASPIQIGQTTQATATTRDANNGVLTGRVVAWSSDNTGVATVTSSGLVTAIAAGSANIIATSEGQSGSSLLTVIPVPVASLTLSALTTPIVLGQAQQLTAIPKDGSGNTLAGRTVSWVSSNPTVLSVSSSSSVSTSSGATINVTAAGVGTAIITANSESAPSVSTTVITVSPIPVASVSVSPSSATLALGVTSTQQLTATLKDSNNNTLTGRTVTWTSSSPSVATVDGNGFVTAVGGGQTTITATSETKTGTSSITVTVPVATVAVSPSSATLTVGLTHQLTATTKDINGSVLTGRVVTWSSSDQTLASVSSTGLVTAVAAGTAVITATSEGKTGPSSITVTPTPVASVSASLSTSTIQVGQTTQATATTFDAGNNILTGRVVTWSTANQAVATVSSSGAVIAIGVGSTTITATSEGKQGGASLAVIAVPVGSVTVVPGSATVIAGATQQLSAETRDANNVVVTDRPVAWSSSNTGIATVNSAGLISAVSAGSATITATSEGKSGASSITVIPVPVASVAVNLSPSSITAVGTSQATATTLDGNGGTLTGRIVTWSSGNPAVATVSPQGLLTAIGVGTAAITATSEGKGGSATLTVTQAPVASVALSPSSATVVQGGTEQLNVTLTDAHGTAVSRSVTWSSSNTAIATVSLTGLVTAMSPGSATITATSEGQSGTSSVTVSPIPVASVSVTLSAGTITDVQSAQATAVVRDADGNVLTGRSIIWSSDNNAVATISPTGVVTAVAAGSTQIRATSGGQTGGAALTVIPAVAAVIVSPPSANVVTGTTLQLAADTRDANNNVLSGRTVTWSSDAPSIATVSTSGLVTTVAFGSATITATSEGKTGASSITVVPVPVAIVTVSLGSTTITVGQTTQASATTRDANGNILTGRSVTWSSGNTSVATLSPTGLVTSVSSGSVQVIAMSEGRTGSATLTVNPAPVASVTLSAPSTPVIVGGTQVLTALPKDASGNTLSGRTVNWVSSNIAVLTVSSAGSVSTTSGATVTVTAVGTGSATITATSELAPSATTSAITVNPVPVTTVTVALTPGSITAVGTSQATATTLDANGAVLTGRSIVWSSTNTAIATVDAQGVVAGVAVGTASITATSEGKIGSATITVTQAPVATISVSLASSSINTIQTTQATATLRDAQGRALTGRAIAWSSDNIGVATVGPSSGLVSAVTVGTANIVATSEGKSGGAVLTVAPAPVATVTLSAPATPMILGGTQQLTATTRDANNNVLTGRTITWISSNTAVLTVSASGSPVTITAVGTGTATITATSESAPSATTPVITVSPVPVATVTVTPPTVSLVLGITPTQQLAAVIKDAGGNVLAGRLVTWVSSNPAAAMVDGNGLVTAVVAGSSTITATSETKTGTSSITVTVAPVNTVTVTPASAGLVLGVTPTQQLTPVTKDANGNVLTGRVVTWASSNPAAATVDANGLVTAAAVGVTTITATSETKTGTSSITVAIAPVNTVAVSPTSASLVVGITPTQQLTAVTKDVNGNVLTGRLVTWTSSNQSAATVDGTGLVNAVGAGATTITATSETKTATSSITVTLAPVNTVTVTPTSATLVIGVTPTQQLTATLRDAASNLLTGRMVAWTSSNPAAATVDGSGLVTAVAAGSTTITATSETKASTSSITVTIAPVNTVTVTPASASLVLGITPTQQLAAVTKDVNSNVLTGRLVTWVSSSSAVATVDGNGLVTAVGAGTTTITATSETKTGTSSITVTLAPVNTVTVTPPSASLVLGITPTEQLTATLRDAASNVLTGRPVLWTSSDQTVATVDANGLVTSVAGGTATITATSETKTGTSSITVALAPVNTVTVTPPSASLVVGITPTQQLTAVTKDANGTVLTGRLVTWTSSNTSAATVDANGLVTALGAGATTITATSETKTGTSSITVTLAPVATVTVAPTTATLVLGITPSQQLTATLRDAASNVLTSRVVVWTSSNQAAAIVDATGLVTAVGAGSTTITATSETKTGTSAITVTVAPVNTVTVTPATATLVLGVIPTQQLTANLTDANSNPLSGRTVNWTSSNVSAATVDANGLVTAVAAGTTTITATSESKTGTSSITVTLAPVNSVAVSPTSASLVVGITPTQRLTATLTDVNGNILTARAVTWTSSDATAATVDANGLVTAVGAGSTTITATSETKTGTSSITVTVAPVATVTLSPASASLVVGITPTQQLTAVTKDANGTLLTGRLVTWTSSNTAAATVDANGLVTAVGAGATIITATSETQTGTSSITVTLAPVNTVSVAPPSATLVLVITPTQQLTSTLRDAANHVLTGRTVTWTSSNTALATVDGNGLVTAVAAGGPATITATSETKTGTSSITVIIPPVNTVTVTPPSAALVLGVIPSQQLTATTKDAHGNTLVGRVVTWSSDNNGVATVSPSGFVTAISAGSATITALSEGVSGTSSITVTVPSNFASVLHVSSTNRRYFENAAGQIVYLTGSHTWSNLQDNGTVDPPPNFNYTAYLDFLDAHHHNFFRLWAWEQSKWTAEISADYWITPGPFLRTGSTNALDGKPKFDLTQFNQAYFDRLRSRVQDAGSRGIYVSVMLFDGWSVAQKGGLTLNNPWKGHPFNAANNINSIDGDTNHDGQGLETQTLGNSAVTAIQDAYVRKVIDAVGDLDNVLYEIDNEGDVTSKAWQYHMIQVIRDYEATKSKQHPIGMTAMFPGGSDTDLTTSDADWISIPGSLESPSTATGAKVLIADTDHICGICGSTSWVWKTFAKGLNPILMDGYDGAAVGLGASDYTASDPVWELIRKNLGYSRDYALRLDLKSAVPHGDLVLSESTGYCLAKPGSQYLVYLPNGGSVTLNLSAVTGSLSAEWLNPATGAISPAAAVIANGSSSVFVPAAPFSGASVLFLH